MRPVVFDWKTFDGASKKPKRLNLKADGNGIFQCPITSCEHQGFFSQRGCRKHVKKTHGWFYYFDERPQMQILEKRKSQQLPFRQHAQHNKESKGFSRAVTQNLPSLSKENNFGKEFSLWLQSTVGGGKSKIQSDQTVSRAFKFLRACVEDLSDDELDSTVVDICLGSPENVCSFIDTMEKDWNIGASGKINYVNAILDLMDFRKYKGISPNVMANFGITEVYIKRGRKCMGKEVRLRLLKELDIDSLEEKGSWASMKELQTVIPFHSEHYKSILTKCKTAPDTISPSDLTFATRFIATVLFIHVKGTRPMTYQYLTLAMFSKAKSSNGFVDQKKFKTTATYMFDSLLFDETSIELIDDYINHVRVLIEPKCDYILVNRNGKQFSKLSGLMGKLVFDAIGKHINPTRYRQIIETESSENLEICEQEWVSEDQKHSSNVARVHYRKKRSRDVAEKGQNCLKKLKGEEGKRAEQSLASLVTKKGSISDCNNLSEQASSPPSEKTANGDASPRVPQRTGAVLHFTPEEDRSLKRGIEKHGHGRWTSILMDSEMKFQNGRTTAALKRRASSKAFQSRK